MTIQQENYKVGDKVLYQPMLSDAVYVEIIAITKGFWGDKYYGSWTADSGEYRHKRIARIYKRNIIKKI